MPDSIFAPEVTASIAAMQAAATQRTTKQVTVDGRQVAVPYPFPSPPDWRDCWIYFLLIDRFNNPGAPPKFGWNKKYGFRQGGTLQGVQRQLGYLQDLGVRAIWLSPVLKNSKPERDGWAFTYPGYNTQDFLNVDERLASDGTRATAERELVQLVDEAHARGMYIIIDIVLNHAARVFDYVFDGGTKDHFSDGNILNAALGGEPSIAWIDAAGQPQSAWRDGNLPAGLGGDDAVWPTDLQRHVFFRRRGNKLSDTPDWRGFVPGDFGVMRQLVAEYDATVAGQQAIRAQYGARPVLSILVRAYEYLIAKYDIDGYRIDTVKYVRPDIVETFGNAIREFALSAGKANFFTFGEVYDNEELINKFVGRNSADVDGFGVDAALDFPLFYKLPTAIKGLSEGVGVDTIRQVFLDRKAQQADLISSHGEAGKYFVSFLDNHDQKERFNAPGTPAEQVTLGMAVLFALQGIPCVYYGAEQGLQGTVDNAGNPERDALECVREALWGKPGGFDTNNAFYKAIQAISRVRAQYPALRYGRLYFREVSGNGTDFGQSFGRGGVIAFSRILTDQEILVIANTNGGSPVNIDVLLDSDLHRGGRSLKIAYSNKGTSATRAVAVKQANVYKPEGVSSGQVAAVRVTLAPNEVQILAPQ
jgi:glycosidase